MTERSGFGMVGGLVYDYLPSYLRGNGDIVHIKDL
jgi:hypothetical protein